MFFSSYSIHFFISSEPRNEAGYDDSDSDGGEFSEGEGISYRDEASDTEQQMKMNTNDDQKFNRRFHEVIEISSDDE